MTFADELKRLRQRLELSQEGLAVKAEISVGNVRNYEQGRRIPTFPVIIKLARALGVDCTAFAGCDDVQGEVEEEKPVAKKKGGKK